MAEVAIIASYVYMSVHACTSQKYHDSPPQHIQLLW